MLFKNNKVDDMFEGTGLKPAGEKKATEEATDESGINPKIHLSIVIIYTVLVLALSVALVREKGVNAGLSEVLTKKDKIISQQAEEIESLNTLVTAQQSKINAAYGGIDVMPNDDPGLGPKEFIGSDSNKSAAETPDHSTNLTLDEYEKKMEELESANRGENLGIDEVTPITESSVSNDPPAGPWPGPQPGKLKNSLGDPISPSY